jgi:hypothetical protein
VCDKVKGTMLLAHRMRRTNKKPNAPRHAMRIPSLPQWALILFLVLLPAALKGQQPLPADHPHGPHPGFPFPHPNIRPPKGEVPKPGTDVNFDATALGSPIALDHNWRLGIAPGTDPAKPDFDDSKWPARDAKEALAEVDDSAAQAEDRDPSAGHGHDGSAEHHHPDGHPFAWFRIHILLPENHGPLVVLVRVPVSRNSQMSFSGAVSMDLFANGKLIVPEGPNGATPEAYQQISRIFPINIPEDQTSLTLAARIPFVPFGLDAYTGFFAHRTFLLGEQEDLRSHLDLWQHSMLFERIPALVDAGLKILLATFLLALFWTQRDHREYLWLGLQSLMVAPLAWVGMLGSTARLEQLSVAA